VATASEEMGADEMPNALSQAESDAIRAKYTSNAIPWKLRRFVSKNRSEKPGNQYELI